MEIKCSKKMYEISEEIKGLTGEARVLQKNGEIEKAKEKLGKISELKNEYETEKGLFEAEKMFSAVEEPDDSKQQKKTVAGASGEPEKDSAFIKAFRNRFGSYELNKSLMSEGSAANGGYTVPQDIQTKINAYKTDRFSFENYITKVNVKTNTGSRTYRKKNQSAPFSVVQEGAAIPLVGNPQYEIVGYEIKKFGGIIMVTNELFSDTAENIENEIAMHFALCREDTINDQVLDILTDKAETALGGSLANVRTALITTLGGAYTPTSKIYTNDDGYAYLCNLQDSNNRDYFFYDPRTGGTPAISLGGRVIPVVQVPNSVLASTPAANNKTKMPFIMGDLKEAVHLFDRQQMSIKASDSATISYTQTVESEEETVSVSAFQNDMTFLRAYLRADFVQVDASSWLNCTITA